MKYHDAERPKDGSGWGRVVDAAGRQLGPLQALIVEPLPDGTWEVRIHLHRAPATFREYSCRLEMLSAVSELLFRYECDPEGVLAEYFKYDFKMDSSHSQARPTAAPSRGTTLEDLGL